MANNDTPFGFRQTNTIFGSDPINATEYKVDSANADPIGLGDPIIVEADGNVTRGVAGSAEDNVAIAIGFYDANGVPVNYLPALSAGTVLGAPVYGVQLMVQASGSIAETDKYALADYVVGAPNANTGISSYELDSTTIGNAGTPMKILGLAPIQNNEWGVNAKVLVQFVANINSSTTGI